MDIRALRLLQIALMGGTGGFLSWGLLQIFLYTHYQMGPLPLLDLFIYQGMVVGTGLGICVKSQNNVLSENYGALKTSLPLGAFFGAMSGLLGFFLGQSLLALPLDIPLFWVRIISWGLLGLWLGILVNLHTATSAQSVVQIAGATLGGLLGGLLLEGFQALPLGIAGLWLGLIFLGMALLLSMTFFQIYSAKGYLRVLTGESEGKVYLLDKPLFSLGYEAHNDLILKGYTEVCATHVHIVKDTPNHQIVNVCLGGQLSVNFRLVDEQNMKNGDVIKLGTALLQYCEVS